MSSRPPLVACWLDTNIGEPGKYLDLKKEAEGISNNIVRWHYFDCGDQFTEFINSNPNIKLVAIMSGRFARQLVTPVADRDALHSVYVYCGNVEKHRALPTLEPKIKGVFDSDKELFRQMRNDLNREFP
jgi:hypothetical protein